MSKISEALKAISDPANIYGKDIRKAIRDGIEACYDDVTSPALNSEAFKAAVQSKIDDGSIAAMTIGEKSLTGDKLADETITKDKLGEDVQAEFSSLKNDINDISTDYIVEVELSDFELLDYAILRNGNKGKDSIYKHIEIQINAYEEIYISGYDYNSIPLYLFKSNSTVNSYYPAEQGTGINFHNKIKIVSQTDGILYVNVLPDKSIKVYKKQKKIILNELPRSIVGYDNLSPGLSNNFEPKIIQKKVEFLNKPCLRNGNFSSSTEYKHAQIQVNSGDKLIIEGYDYLAVPLYVFKNTSGLVTSYPTDESNAVRENKIEFTATDDGILYINKLPNHDTFVYETADEFSIKGLGEKINNLLIGKRIHFDGDSVCRGAGIGENHQIPFGEQIANRNNMIFTNNAVSGTTLSKQEGVSNSILERIKNFTDKVDYLVLEGGYNDVGKAIPIGVLTNSYIEELNEYTVIGAVESICKYLVENYFETKKLFVLGSRCISFVNQDKYWDAIILALEKWGIPYIDLRKECNLYGFNSFILNNYYYDSNNSGIGDGLHPNTLAYSIFWVPKIESKMLML